RSESRNAVPGVPFAAVFVAVLVGVIASRPVAGIIFVLDDDAILRSIRVAASYDLSLIFGRRDEFGRGCVGSHVSLLSCQRPIHQPMSTLYTPSPKMQVFFMRPDERLY